MLIAQSCPTLCDPLDCSLLWPWGFPGKNTGVGCHSLLQGIFPTRGLLHCRQILYHLSLQGSWNSMCPSPNKQGWERRSTSLSLCVNPSFTFPYPVSRCASQDDWYWQYLLPPRENPIPNHRDGYNPNRTTTSEHDRGAPTLSFVVEKQKWLIRRQRNHKARGKVNELYLASTDDFSGWFCFLDGLALLITSCTISEKTWHVFKATLIGIRESKSLQSCPTLCDPYGL